MKDHVLLPYASRLEEVDAAYRALLTPEVFRELADLVPDEWLDDPVPQRDVYARFLTSRLAHSSVFVNAALYARNALV